MQAPEFAAAISSLLLQLGSAYTEAGLRRATRECRDDINGDTTANGGDIDEPFFNFVIAGGVVVFTFFESDFSVYVLPCDEVELISQTNRFALADTSECKRFLAAQYQKQKPDLSICRSVCDAWLGTG